jgi:hypothetical protein
VENPTESGRIIEIDIAPALQQLEVQVQEGKLDASIV